MTESSFPIWATILIIGVFVNYLIGFLNPYVPKEYRKKAEKYREGDYLDDKPIIPVYCRLSVVVYLCGTAIIVLLATLFFFIESFMKLVDAMPGDAISGVIVLGMFVVGVIVSTLVLLSAAVTGEMIEFDSIKRYYSAHYRIKVIDKREEIELKL